MIQKNKKIQQRPGLGYLSRRGVCCLWEVTGMHILEELYTGNVRPGERSFRQNSQYSRALVQAVE